MTTRETDATAVECLAAAGLPAGDVRDWLQAEPGGTTDFPADRREILRLLAEIGAAPGAAAAQAAPQCGRACGRGARSRSGRATPACAFFAATPMPSTTR